MPWRVRDEPGVTGCLGGNDLIGFFGRMFPQTCIRRVSILGFSEAPRVAPSVAADELGVALEFARDFPIVRLSEGGGTPGSLSEPATGDDSAECLAENS